MLTYSITLAAALALGSPAGAAGAPEPTAAATPRADDRAAARAQASPVRYCIESTPTGTRLKRRTCYTRKEWLDHGLDPLAPVE